MRPGQGWIHSLINNSISSGPIEWFVTYVKVDFASDVLNDCSGSYNIGPRPETSS